MRCAKLAVCRAVTLILIARFLTARLFALTRISGQRFDYFRVKAHLNQVGTSYICRSVRLINSILYRTCIRADFVFFGRDNLNANTAIRNAQRNRIRPVAVVLFAKIVFILTRLQKRQGVNYRILACAGVFPPDFDNANLGKQRVLEPVMEYQKAGVVAVDDIIDIFSRLFGLLNIFRPTRAERYCIFSADKRLQDSRHRVVDYDPNRAVNNL